MGAGEKGMEKGERKRKVETNATGISANYPVISAN